MERLHRTTVWGILNNSAYCGQAAFGKTRYGASDRCLWPQRRQRFPVSQTITPIPANQWQSIPVPALIDADLFAAVQAQLQENRRLKLCFSALLQLVRFVRFQLLACSYDHSCYRKERMHREIATSPD